MLSWSKRLLGVYGVQKFIETGLLGNISQFVADYFPGHGERALFQINFVIQSTGDQSFTSLTTGTMHVHTGREADLEITRERLAEYLHETWASWMRVQREGGAEPDKWARQITKRYDDLEDKDKARSRAEANKILEIFGRVERQAT